jgi:anti-anti-sigma factor
MARRIVHSAPEHEPKWGHSDLPAPPFSVRGFRTPDGYRLVVVGELDLATGPLLTDQLIEAERRRPGTLTLDLSGLTFMSGAGMRILLHAARRAQRERRGLVVLNPRPHIRRLFELTAVDRSLDIRSE